MESEISRLRQQIEAEYESAQRGLHGYSLVSRHTFINAKTKKLAGYHEQLATLIGEKAAVETLIAINLEVYQKQHSFTSHNSQGDKPSLMELRRSWGLTSLEVAQKAELPLRIEYLAELRVPIGEQEANALVYALSALTGHFYKRDEIDIPIKAEVL